MADPLSIITCVLAIVKLGSQLTNDFERVLKLKYAPDTVLALRNEVSDVCIFLEDVQDQLGRCSLESITPPASLVRAIQRTKETVLQIESFIAYDLVVADSDKSYERIDKSRWLRAQPKIQELQMRMRSNKVDLSLGLTTIALSSTLEEVSRKRQIIAFNEDFHSYIREAMSEFSQPSGHQKNTSPHSTYPSESDADCLPKLSTESDVVAKSDNFDDASVGVSQAPFNQAKFTAVIEMISTEDCNFSCSCVCHKKSVTRTPRFLDRVLGSLFLGYQAAPWFAQPCNQPLCRAGLTRVSYTFVFPRWFLNRMLQASLSFNHVQGPELVVRLMRVRSSRDVPFSLVYQYYTPEMRSVEANEAMYVAVKSAMENAEACVLDVTPNNFTILDCAIRAMNFKLVEYLLKMGADPHFESNNGVYACDHQNPSRWRGILTLGRCRSPYVRAWRKILSEPESSGSMVLSKLFDQSHLSSFGFSRLHRAFLGLSGETFSSVLKTIDRTEIDFVDTFSRTTLSWAAARGDRDAVAQLLACGADPNKKDEQGRTPFYWAATSSANYECVIQLIKAKARADIRDNIGFTPLMHIASHENPESVYILLQLGVDASSIESFGFSVMESVVHPKNHAALVTLLRRAGLDAIHVAIIQHLAKAADGKLLALVIQHAERLANDSYQLEQMGQILEIAKKRRDQNLTGDNCRSLKPWQGLFKDPMRWLEIVEDLAFILHGLPVAQKNPVSES